MKNTDTRSLVLCFVVCLACSNEHQICSETTILPIIDITKEVSDLAEYVEDISILPLKEDSTFFMPAAKKMIVHSKGYAILAGGSVFGFDDNGNFTHRYGRIGRGPGEYLYILDICMKEDELMCLTSQNEVLFYSLQDGSFQRKIEPVFRGMTANAVFPMMSNKFALFFPNPPREDLSDFTKAFYQLRIINERGQQTEKKLLRSDFSVSMSFLPASIQNAGNRYILSPTISSGECYLIDSTGVFPFAYIDLGKRSLPEKYAFQDGNNPWEKVEEIFEEPYYKCAMNICAFFGFYYCTVFYAHSSVWNILTDGNQGIRWQSSAGPSLPLWPMAADESYLYYLYSPSKTYSCADPLGSLFDKKRTQEQIGNTSVCVVKVRFSI